MTNEEFNKFCSEVMGYEIFNNLESTCIYHAGAIYQPSTDLNQMAEVFDKLMSKETFILMKFWTYKHPDAVQLPIAQAMREFIESTHDES